MLHRQAGPGHGFAQHLFQDGGIRGGAQIVGPAFAQLVAGDGSILLVEGIVVAVQHFRPVRHDHIPEDTRGAAAVVADQGDAVVFLHTLGLLDMQAQQFAAVYRQHLAEG